MQLTRWAVALAFDNAGKSIAARIAIMAITTRSSISVNAAAREGQGRGLNCVDFIKRGFQWTLDREINGIEPTCSGRQFARPGVHKQAYRQSPARQGVLIISYRSSSPVFFPRSWESQPGR